MPIDYEVTIDLNGHVLKMAYGASGSVIVVRDKDRLTVIDSNPTAEHKFKVNGVGLWVLDDSGTETVFGGVITGGSEGSRSSAICVGGNGGKVIMNAGNIVGHRNGDGGAVSITAGGQFTMTGGSIMGWAAMPPAKAALCTWL